MVVGKEFVSQLFSSKTKEVKKNCFIVGSNEHCSDAKASRAFGRGEQLEPGTQVGRNMIK